MANQPESKSRQATLTATRVEPSAASDVLEQHPGEVIDPLEPVYVLPGDLLDVIEAVMRGWLSAEEIDYERQLAELGRRCAAIGFAASAPLQYNLIALPEPSELTRDCFLELRWDQYWTYEEACSLLEIGSKRVEPLRDQQEAYVGWLITSPHFLSERDELRQLERDELAAGNEIDPCGDPADQLREFCRRWKLSGFVTWDLPLPLGVDVSGIGITPGGRHDEMIHLAVPPTMRLPARYPIREVISEIRNTESADHLAEWNEIVDQEAKSSLGMDRYRRILRLHFYLNIALASRYGARIRGKTEQLDFVFAEFFGDIGEDSVRKLRQAINRRLQAA